MSSDSSTSDGIGNRPKVLLLGISYPDVKGHMDHHGYSEKLLVHKKLSVDQAVELVRRGILTEMDARDLARCVATEQVGEGGLEAYTVSKEVGGVYRKDRHVYANFNNSRGLYNALTQNFGALEFDQVILDYYWMPTGWLVTRWAKSLFQQTLPDLVRYKMLAFPDISSLQQSNENDPNQGNISPTPDSSIPGTPDKLSDVELSSDVGDNEDAEDFRNKEIPSIGDDSCTNNKVDNTIALEKGVVFLPFCAHVCKELVGGIHILKKYYAITFVHKKELPGHALWKGTMKIDANIMQHRLGKRLDQEEIYCTFQPKDIYGSMEDSHIQKDDVMKMLLSIENFKQIRMIRLRPLRQHHPDWANRDSDMKPEVGGFIGLNWAMGKRRFKEFRTRKKAPPPRQLTSKPRRRKTSDTDSESSVSSSDDDTTLGDDDNMFDDHYVDIDFDPYDPDNIAETTNFFPYPALDLVSYIDGKEIVNDDRVMDSWAETWGTKISRKKNRKQDILQSGFQELQRQQKGYLSSHPNLLEPGAEEVQGYTWTLSESGWVSTLNGDDPEWEIIPKIVKIAKKDHAMTACRQLFEMKNPGYKTLSRSYGYNSHMSCYQLPKSSVLAKITCAKDAEMSLEAKTRKAEAAERSVAEGLLDLKGSPKDDEVDSSSMVTPIEEMSLEMMKKLDSKSLSAHLKGYGQTKVPRGKSAKRAMLAELLEKREKENERLYLLNAAAQEQDPDIPAKYVLEQLADVAFQHSKIRTDDPLPNETEEAVKSNGSDFPIKVKEFVAHEDLPPFKAAWTHIAYDLSGSDQFPHELYRLVQDAEPLVITHIISWQEKGKSFVVHDKAIFEEKILVKCTGDGESTFDFFVENLKSFGFAEITEGSRKGGYRHEFFRRRRPEDVALVSRVDNESSDVENSVNDADSAVEIEPNSSKALMGTKSSSRSPSGNDAQAPSANGTKLAGETEFLKELHRLLEEAKEEGIVDFFCWSSGGMSFCISDDEVFVKEILEKHTKTTKMSTFEASLFNFGFKKSGMSGGQRRYEHPLFVQGRPEKIPEITLRPRRQLVSKSVFLSRKRKSSEQRAGVKTDRLKSSPKSSEPSVSVSASAMESTPSISPHERMSDVAESLRLILDKNEDSTVVRWLPDGTAFSVAKPDKFESKILPKYFPHVSYPSFRRELKALGFDSAGTTGELKGIMFHGLFQRDFPELWKLHDDHDLDEKVLYCLSYDKLLLEKLIGDNLEMSRSRETKELLRWKEFPALQDFLYDSITSHFPLLIANRTKLQGELLSKMTTQMLEIARKMGYKLDESLNEAQIAATLRTFYRLHFQMVRKHLQVMKTDTENGEAKATLQSIILKAVSVDFDALPAPKSSFDIFEVDFSEKQFGDVASISQNHPEKLAATKSGSSKAGDAVEHAGGNKVPANARTDNNISKTADGGHVEDKANGVESTSSGTGTNGKKAAKTDAVSSRSEKKRKVTSSVSKSKQAPSSKQKKPRRTPSTTKPESFACSGVSRSMMSTHTTMVAQTSNQVASHDVAIHQGTEQRIAVPPMDSLRQITNGIVHRALQALDNSLLQSNDASIVDILRRNQNSRYVCQATVSPRTTTRKLIHLFPVKTLGAYLNLNFNQLTSSADAINFMDGIVFPDFNVPPVDPQERHRRLQVYIKLLESLEGSLWRKVLEETPPHLRADLIRQKLTECFINERFQKLVFQHESHEDALFWCNQYGEILQAMKDGLSLQINNQQSPHQHRQLDMHQTPQLLQQALLQQQQQQQQLNDLRNLATAEPLQILSLVNRGSVSAVATPSPPMETLTRNESPSHTNLLEALAAASALNQNATGFNGAYNNFSL